MQKIDGVRIETAVPTEKILENIEENSKLYLKRVNSLSGWRKDTRIAVVGSGPSLKDHVHELLAYEYIMACGSVNDYLAKRYIFPTYTIVCDPDPLVVKYLSITNCHTTYLVASQCHPSVFEHLKDCSVFMWHASGHDKYVFDNQSAIIRGGCTVGTRGIVAAINLGFSNIDLFGFDTCLSNGESHVFAFVNPEAEKIVDTIDICVGDATFTMAKYMLGQLFDFKQILLQDGRAVKFTAYCDGPIAKLLQIAKEKVKEYGKEV